MPVGSSVGVGVAGSGDGLVVASGVGAGSANALPCADVGLLAAGEGPGGYLGNGVGSSSHADSKATVSRQRRPVLQTNRRIDAPENLYNSWRG